MTKDSEKNSTREAFEALEKKVQSLIENCDYLAEENRLLKVQEERLKEERAVLMEKNYTARTRVGAIISRLKSLEANT